MEGLVAEWLSRLRERLLASFHPNIPKTNKSFSGEDARTRSRTRDLKPKVIVVLYTDLLFQLPPTQQVVMDVDSHLMGGTYQMN